MQSAEDPSARAHVVNEDRYAPIPEALLYDPDISADAVRVYGVLRRHGDDPTNCYPSQSRIATLIGRAPRSINGWLRQLEQAGWIERIIRYTEAGDLDSNGYRVFMVRRASQRGVRAGGRVPVRASERGGYAPDSAINESQLNESQEERETARAGSFFDDGADEQSTDDGRVAWKLPAVIADAGNLDAAIELCEHWAGRLADRGVRVDGKARSKAWVVPMEALLRLDEHPPEHVRRVVDWLEDGRDDVARFWQGNVLSPDKLRARWDVMGQQYRRLRTSGRSGAAALIDEYGGTE